MELQDSGAAGFINVYKEKGFTSHDVVAMIKKITGRKAGHTGTLDPNAAGVLPICLGRATKLADYVAGADKEYVAQILFGAETSTEDAWGEITLEKPVTAGEEAMKEMIHSFVGEQSQVPPMYSAIKVNGQRLYKLARAGMETQRAPRKITVYSIDILDMDYPKTARIKVNCGKGTYIRSLVRDIGRRAGGAAHMGELLRTRVGDFLIEDARNLSQIKEITANGGLSSILLPMETALADYRKAVAPEKVEKLLSNGNKISFEIMGIKPEPGERLAVFDAAGRIRGLYEAVEEGFIKLVVML